MPAEPTVHAVITVPERTITRTDSDVSLREKRQAGKSCPINLWIHRGQNKATGPGLSPESCHEKTENKNRINRQVNRLGILYGGSDILGACGSPDYLVSHRSDDRIVVSITIFLIAVVKGGPKIHR
jgi:hypothetical protein